VPFFLPIELRIVLSLSDVGKSRLGLILHFAKNGYTKTARFLSRESETQVIAALNSTDGRTK
jgi:hypothetical protein